MNIILIFSITLRSFNLISFTFLGGIQIFFDEGEKRSDRYWVAPPPPHTHTHTHTHTQGRNFGITAEAVLAYFARPIRSGRRTFAKKTFSKKIFRTKTQIFQSYFRKFIKIFSTSITFR